MRVERRRGVDKESAVSSTPLPLPHLLHLPLSYFIPHLVFPLSHLLSPFLILPPSPSPLHLHFLFSIRPISSSFLPSPPSSTPFHSSSSHLSYLFFSPSLSLSISLFSFTFTLLSLSEFSLDLCTCK